MGGTKSKPATQTVTPTQPIVTPPANTGALHKVPLKSTAPIKDLLAEYAHNYAVAGVRKEWLHQAQVAANTVMKNMGIYTIVADKVTRIPAYVIGLIHMMESGFNFKTHLHNGDPLSARTVQVPAGRPKKGNPPFTWSESAMDALLTDRVGSVPEWTLGYTLRFLEGYNGWGPRNAHQGLTAYLWSGTDLYTRGKYIADGVWSETAVSKQIGCVAVMKCLPKDMLFD